MVTRESLLIVDDLELMRSLMIVLCEHLGFRQIDVASTGFEALQLLKTQRYSLVISDLNMKPMDGIDLLRIIRGDPETAHVKFIMITVSTEFRAAMDAKQSGADMYLLKPFTPKKLMETVDQVMGAAPALSSGSMHRPIIDTRLA